MRKRQIKTHFCILKYKYGQGNHFEEGHHVNSIGIPNRKGTKGIRILKSTDKGDTVRTMLYDVEAKIVRGFFETTGQTYVDHTEVFCKDPRSGDEDWSLRVPGMSHVVPAERAIPIAQLKAKFPTIRITKGSMQHVPEAAIEFCVNRFSVM